MKDLIKQSCVNCVLSLTTDRANSLNALNN